MKVLIIIGHRKGYKEFVYNLITASRMYEILRNNGIDVTIDTHDTEVAEEVALVNRGNYDIIISVHYNAGGGDGFECFYWEGDSKGINLCQLIEKRIKEIGQNSRGCKRGNQYMIINSVKPLSIILEGAFMDNLTDWTGINLDDMGVAYAKGVLDYLGKDFNYNTITKKEEFIISLSDIKNKGFSNIKIIE